MDDLERGGVGRKVREERGVALEREACSFAGLVEIEGGVWVEVEEEEEE